MTSWAAGAEDPFDAVRKFFGDVQDWLAGPRGPRPGPGPGGDRWEQTREQPRERPRPEPHQAGGPFGFPFGWAGKGEWPGRGGWPGGPGRGGWPGGPGRGWHGGHRGPRAGRGDVRLAILALLAEQPMHGYQLIQEISRRSAGGWRPSPGSVYPTLQQLEDEGLVRADERDGKRVYSLTADGRAVADERAEEFASLWDGYQPNDDDAELGDLVFGVAAAFVHVMRTGSDRQIAAARRVLARTRTDLYRILGDDPVGSGGSSATSATSGTEPDADRGDNGGTGRSDAAESGEGEHDGQHDGDGSGGRP